MHFPDLYTRVLTNLLGDHKHQTLNIIVMRFYSLAHIHCLHDLEARNKHDLACDGAYFILPLHGYARANLSTAHKQIW